MRTQAIILKKIPIREYDELIVCYDKERGKQVYHAKSNLRPSSRRAGHLDILNLADFVLVPSSGSSKFDGEAGRHIIASAYCLDAFRRLKSSLPAMSCAYFLLECFDKIIFEGEPDARLWNFLLSRLKELDKSALNARADWLAILGSTRRELLNVLGYHTGASIEELANARFKSLQFASKVLR